MHPWIVIDFESASFIDLKKAGAYRYAEDPTTEVLCMAWSAYDGNSGVWMPGDPMPLEFEKAELLGDFLFIAHNAAFERNIWRHHMEPLGWPAIPLEQWADTMARCHQIALPGSLEGALIALGLPLHKDTAGTKLTVGLSKPDRKTGMLPARTPQVLQRVADYCASDVENQVALHKWLGLLPAHERSIWELSQKMNDRGLRLDMNLARAMQRVVDRASKPLAAEFEAITGGLKFTQIAKLREWVVSQGVPVEDLAAETIDALLGELGDGDDQEPEADSETDAENNASGDGEGVKEAAHVVLPENVRRALSIRRLIGSASIKKLKAMEHCVGFDGRAHGTYRYHGTTPGRQTAMLFQPHNFPRGSNEVIELPVDVKVQALMTGDPEWVETVLGVPPVEAVVGSLRHIICADPGRKLMAGDYSGIQARTVLALAGQHDKTALMASGADVYCDMASNIYRKPVTKADTAERQVGKNSVLGLGFGMGWKKFFDKYCAGQEITFAKQVVDVYRQEWAPLVPKVWYGLQDAAVQTVWTGKEHESHGIIYRLEDQWLTAEIPNGSKLWYFDPKPVTRKMSWSTDDEPDYRKGFQYRVQKGGRLITRDSWGGALCENCVMKIERELVETAKLKLEAEGYNPVGENHDEILCEPLTDASLETFKEIMLDVPNWVKTMRIPVAVDAWEGSRYRK